MNELNLTFQIAYGYLLQNSGIVLAILIAAVVFYGALIGKRLPLINGKCIKTAVMFGVALWLFFIFTLPAMTMSSLAQVTYSTDWFMLLFMSFGYAAIGTFLVYPVLRLLKRS